MQGLTASHFVTQTYAIKPGDISLVHAAAGGVGLMLTQTSKFLPVLIGCRPRRFWHRQNLLW